MKYWSRSRPRPHEVLVSVSYVLVSCWSQIDLVFLKCNDSWLCSVNTPLSDGHYQYILLVKKSSSSSIFRRWFIFTYVKHTDVFNFHLQLNWQDWSRSRSRTLWSRCWRWSHYVQVLLTNFVYIVLGRSVVLATETGKFCSSLFPALCRPDICWLDESHSTLQ